MKCAVMQPTYLPWLGYFDLISRADKFVIYDHVQFEKQSWQQRNRIRNKQGELVLGVSVINDKGLERRINEVRIDHSRNILGKHLTSIQMAYSKAVNFEVLFPEIEKIYKEKHELLIRLNMAFISLGTKYFDLSPDFLYSGEMDIQGQKVEALIDVCKKLGADQYLSPAGSKGYIDENNLFPENNIELSYQQYTPPVYQQGNASEFISHLSFIDYLFNTDLREAAVLFKK